MNDILEYILLAPIVIWLLKVVLDGIQTFLTENEVLRLLNKKPGQKFEVREIEKALNKPHDDEILVSALINLWSRKKVQYHRDRNMYRLTNRHYYWVDPPLHSPP